MNTYSFFYGLAITACAEEINPVIQNLEPCLFDHFLCQVFKTAQVRINDFLAFGANNMRVRIRLVAVISIASVREAELQHFAQLFEQINRLIYCGNAGGWKFSPDRFIYPLNGGMTIADSQHFQNSQSLGRQTEVVFLQL